jgi:hypothetical protein
MNPSCFVTTKICILKKIDSLWTSLSTVFTYLAAEWLSNFKITQFLEFVWCAHDKRHDMIIVIRLIFYLIVIIFYTMCPCHVTIIFCEPIRPLMLHSTIFKFILKLYIAVFKYLLGLKKCPLIIEAVYASVGSFNYLVNIYYINLLNKS